MGFRNGQRVTCWICDGQRNHQTFRMVGGEGAGMRQRATTRSAPARVDTEGPFPGKECNDPWCRHDVGRTGKIVHFDLCLSWPF